MENFGFKATFYDLVGYIVPGAISIFLFYINFVSFDFANAVNFLKEDRSAFLYIFFVAASYVIGYAISAASALIFERKFITNAMSFIYSMDMTQYDAYCIKHFNQEYKKCNQQILNSYCQVNFPSIYETAFAFLSIYGLSRNIAAILLIFFPFFLNSIFLSCNVFFAYAALIWLFSHNYFRFKVYYLHKIASSLALVKS